MQQDALSVDADMFGAPLPMNAQDALAIAESLLAEACLSPLQKTVLCQAWEGKSYQEIARESGYELGYIKQTGSQLWKLLSRSLNQRVTKHNLKLALLSV
ncbi:MAG: hypothetical protein AAF289_18245, partial [Cyanobacteria bacterium P01_A01_bin.135]